MTDIDNKSLIYIGEELDDIFGEDENIDQTPSKLTRKMREKLINNLIDEGYLEHVTLH